MRCSAATAPTERNPAVHSAPRLRSRKLTVPVFRRSSITDAFGRLSDHNDLSGGPFLLVASTGGHLIELYRLVEMWGGAAEASWITFDTPQSRDLLRGLDVEFVPYVSPRDWRGVLTVARLIRRRLRRTPVAGIVSTGAAVALSAALAGLATRTRLLYVESIARTRGPSLTGALLQYMPGTRLRTQVAAWKSRRWRFAGSVLQGYEARPVESQITRPRLFVTLGTIAPYRFDSLVDAVLATGLADSTTVWQTGSTTRTDLPGRTMESMGYLDIRNAMLQADVVVTHGGVGTILDCLDMGKRPVIVPRRMERGEHVDDHQLDFAKEIETSGLGTVAEAPRLTADTLIRASGTRIELRD